MADRYYLAKGSHRTREHGMCAMEWVAYLAGEPHSDTPQCVSTVLTRFCIGLNDSLPDDRRQRLRPYLARTIGTRGDGHDEQRQWMAADWLVRVHVPAWLAVAGLDETAQRLWSLAPVSPATVDRAIDQLREARREALDAIQAARAAIGAAATGEVVWQAAWDAARGAAEDAAVGAVLGAIESIVPGASRAIVRDAARSAAWGAASAAVWGAVRATARNAAWKEAHAAARSALQPTVKQLQDSAFDLLDRMLPTEPLELPVAPNADKVCVTA